MSDTTIVNTPGTGESNAASVVLVFVLIAVIAGGTLVWYRYMRVSPPTTPAGDTRINITVPAVPTSATPPTSD